jgi:hypothetical protein
MITTADWTYTYTINYTGGLTAPPNGSSTVACAGLATNPGAPDPIFDACDRLVFPVLVGQDAPTPECEGQVVWRYRYTACDLTTTADWIYTYTIIHTPPTQVGQPAQTSSTVNCYLDAIAPPAPVFVNSCNIPLTPSAVIQGGTNTGGCNGTITFTYNYTDCDNVVYPWTYTYNITCDPVVLKVWLEGPYSTTTHNMSLEMNDNGLLPGENAPDFWFDYPAGHPYNTAPWNYSGAPGNTGTQWGDFGGQTPYPPTVVDWVLVTIRKNGLLPANNIWTCAGWVHQNGNVTFPESCPLPAFSTADLYYFVVQHRNHLGIMSPADVDMPCGTAQLEWDFRAQTPISLFSGLDRNRWKPMSGQCMELMESRSARSRLSIHWTGQSGRTCKASWATTWVTLICLVLRMDLMKRFGRLTKTRHPELYFID